jgi:hypothetical protein
LVEAQSRDHNPQYNSAELMELIELRRRIEEVEVEILMGDISKVLMDLIIPPIPGIPRDPRTIDNVLEVAGTILECLWEVYAFSHGTWD